MRQDLINLVSLEDPGISRYREVIDEERAQGRQVIGGARMIVNTIVETAMRQHAADRDRGHQTPGIAL